KGTVHLDIGGGGTTTPSNGLFIPEPRCREVTGIGAATDANGRKAPIYVVEQAPWSAFRDSRNPYGFVAFDVDPGQPGGNTTIKATHYAINGPYGAISVVEQFTLTRPRGG
ncbi:MAG: hypothetical protein QOG47_539, partial [Mycobacterium sp.]|nr:hypothetical protein [Mycobacterium sp.]